MQGLRVLRKGAWGVASLYLHEVNEPGSPESISGRHERQDKYVMA